MELNELMQSIRQDAVAVVFVNVFLQQLGLPIPAVPTLLIVGSLLTGLGDSGPVFFAMVAASVVADWIWYLLGRAFGYRVLSGLCRLSINPGSCVTQTEERFVRWGLWSLVVAKFIPGFSIVAPPIAGALRMSLSGFLTAAAAGALLWGGTAIGAGWIFRTELHVLLAGLDRQGNNIVVAVIGVVALWLAWKFWQKYRFGKLAAIPHITPAELVAAMASANPPRLLDLRGTVAIAETGIVRGAVAAEHDDPLAAVVDWPKSDLVVTLCACPQDAGAVLAARLLMEQGYTSVRPLRGGFDALPATLLPEGVR